ncbi:AGAP006705-PA-like protein [Anopheles sinensis]|uniref:AGAP006705-PA-like protein n=1 Tax=Anopheles sinensis TaxID=74873 RepID=A0A084WLM1_ANOSI|nr:AGAP006705-PA-like protein [Anopheles sinensis]
MRSDGRSWAHKSVRTGPLIGVTSSGLVCFHHRGGTDNCNPSPSTGSFGNYHGFTGQFSTEQRQQHTWPSLDSLDRIPDHRQPAGPRNQWFSQRPPPPSSTVAPKVQRKRGSISGGKKNVVVQQPTAGGGPLDNANNSREALSHEGSEPVVYVSDTSGYIPLTALQSSHQRLPPPPQPSVYGGDLDAAAWRPDPWDRDYNRRYRFNNTRVQHIEAECQDDYMKIRIGFNGSFNGLLYSSGYAYDPDCMYINGSGRDYYEFFIQLNRCGTLGKNAIGEDSRKNPTKNFMWNTVTVQYNPLIEEEFDEHFKVTCEYGYDFWKTVTFPFLDVEVATGNPVVFTLSPPECYMEIRNGYGTNGARVTGPVRVGDPLTLIIYMRSKYDGFDIVVNDCFAHNGANKRIQLIDEYGCPVDDKLISRFRGSWSDTGVFETQVYAYMKTFRFTGSPALYIECDVRMCHGRCPSQPCHWRNLKGVSKREAVQPAVNTTLSDNISLFQALRVLQEDDEEARAKKESITSAKPQQDMSETCMKTSVLSALLATCCVLLCVLGGSLLAACGKLRHRKKDAAFFDNYVGHKAQLD